MFLEEHQGLIVIRANVRIGITYFLTQQSTSLVSAPTHPWPLLGAWLLFPSRIDACAVKDARKKGVLIMYGL